LPCYTLITPPLSHHTLAVGDFSITLDFAERDVPVTLKILGSDDHHDEGAPVEQLEKLMLLTGGMA